MGRRIGLQLHAAGITTVQQLRNASPSWLRAKFGVVMERTGNELRGISCLALEEVAAPRKEIISSRSFGQLVHTLPELSEFVAGYMSSAAEKLRRENYRRTLPRFRNGWDMRILRQRGFMIIARHGQRIARRLR